MLVKTKAEFERICGHVYTTKFGWCKLHWCTAAKVCVLLMHTWLLVITGNSCVNGKFSASQIVAQCVMVQHIMPFGKFSVLWDRNDSPRDLWELGVMLPACNFLYRMPFISHNFCAFRGKKKNPQGTFWYLSSVIEVWTPQKSALHRWMLQIEDLHNSPVFADPEEVPQQWGTR